MTSQPRNRSEDISGLIKALAAAQGEIKDIARNREVEVRTQKGGSYKFKYATLSAVIDGIRTPLSKHGLAYTQSIDFDAGPGFYVLTTTLHWENQWISSTTPIIQSGGSNQEFGSALTYMKRYALAALVGVAPDEDDDGNIADGNQVNSMQEAINRGPSAPLAPNPISPPTPVEGPEALPFSPNKIATSVVAGTGGKIDWMLWGQNIVAMGRIAPSNAALDALLRNNAEALEGMKVDAPKLYRNLNDAFNKMNPGAKPNAAE